MSVDKTQFAIESTAMAIRENLMDYFKGTCVQRFTTCNVELVGVGLHIDHEGRAFNYEREQHSLRRPMHVLIGGEPVMQVSLYPSKVTFYTARTKPSSQLSKVVEKVSQFLDDYLPTVEKGEQDGPIYR